MQQPLSILYISFNMPWRGGGTFYRAHGFARHLVQRGHRVTLLATSLEQKWDFREEVVDGVQLLLAPAVLAGKLRSGWDPYEVVRRCHRLQKYSFDLIHGFESRPVVILPALYARRRMEAPLILDWCDWFGRGGSVEERSGLAKHLLRPVETFFEEHYRTRAQGTTVINSLLRRRAIELGVAPETIHQLPNGASTERLRVLERKQARRMVGLPQDGIVVGHLGQAFVRDAMLMTEAFAALQRVRPDARLLLIGNHKTDIAAYTNADNTLLETGFVTDEELNLYLAASDLLWLPLSDTLANRGRWPMKINDYMAAGRATVSTTVGDLVSLFRGDRPIGRLADDEPDDLAKQTLLLLEDEEARRMCEKNARMLAETRFAWPKVTADLEAFYYEVLEKKG